MQKLTDGVGLGLKPRHQGEILDGNHGVDWFEVHAENYMGDGGPVLSSLDDVRREYPVSLHGVGLSPGSVDEPDSLHLARLRRLIDRYQPALVSEHLAWSRYRDRVLNDLLPLPYTEESLKIVARNIDHAQSVLGRPLLIENPSVYAGFAHSTLGEPEFLAALAEHTGCGLLLDINNVYVSARNLGFDPQEYLARFPLTAVGEIHLAGHSVEAVQGSVLLIDDHGSPVTDTVWELFAHVVNHLATDVPVLIEWDTDVPEWPVLLTEVDKARAILRQGRRNHSGVDHGVP